MSKTVMMIDDSGSLRGAVNLVLQTACYAVPEAVDRLRA